MTAGIHIKDRSRQLDARRKRDSCKFYSYHSGSCSEYKIMACYKCLRSKKKSVIKMKIRCQVCNKEIELNKEEIAVNRILTLCPHKGQNKRKEV